MGFFIKEIFSLAENFEFNFKFEPFPFKENLFPYSEIFSFYINQATIFLKKWSKGPKKKWSKGA
jgi:hypothetical protein